MTGKEDYSQLELFSQTQESGQSGARVSRSFLQYIWLYEKAIMLVVGFIVTGSIAYCVGVEKGKHLVLPRTNAQLDLAVNAAATSVKPVVKESIIKPAAVRRPMKLTQSLPAAQPVAVAKAVPADSAVAMPPVAAVGMQSGAYTIQIASYQTRALADQERLSLQKKGLTVVVLSKGKYTVLCVGNFSDKQKAQSVLTDLKRKYRDCYIRRL